nr:MAG TPA: hypothetical protein [Caudoviricetes sp.]DAV07390.1 MAG TPA: hypothetical protein [Caudoviricetes sp.]
MQNYCEVATPREAECKAERKCLSRNLQKDNICYHFVII